MTIRAHENCGTWGNLNALRSITKDVYDIGIGLRHPSCKPKLDARELQTVNELRPSVIVHLTMTSACLMSLPSSSVVALATPP